MISFIASTQVVINTQILCSLSPYFKEDLSLLRSWWLQSLGKHRREDFHQYRYKELAPKVKTKTFLLVGNEETKEIHRTDKAVFNLLNCEKDLEFIPDTKHDVSDQNYLNVVNKIVSRI